MEDAGQAKLDFDAQLLAEAFIELNILRKHLSLYPPEHPTRKDSLQKTHNHLLRLLELRETITIGIAGDSLAIDQYTLDKKNPVYREFALSLSSKGISAITFSAGIEPNELVLLNELVMMRDGPVGEELHRLALNRGLIHVLLHPIKLSSFRFQEGKKQGPSKRKLWEDYIYGLLHGKLSEDDTEEIVTVIPPEEIGSLINDLMAEDSPDVSYERVVSAYLTQKSQQGVRGGPFDMFRSLIESLKPTLKVQFLKTAIGLYPARTEQLEMLLSSLSEEELQRLLEALKDRDSIMPETVSNFLRKIGKVTPGEEHHDDTTVGEKSAIDDFEIDEKVLQLLHEDKFKTFVDEQYQSDLKAMLKGYEGRAGSLAKTIHEEISESVLDRSFSEVIYELLEIPYLSREDHQKLIAQLSETANVFLQTGRFQELFDMFNAIHTTSAREDASRGRAFFFQSRTFIAGLVDALTQWGRFNRDGALRLAQLLRVELVNPLLDALADESDATRRKFILHLLSNMGNEVLPAAVKRLQDRRWFMVRNMLYLIREAGGHEYASYAQKFVNNSNIKVRIEALKSLLYFKTADSFSHLDTALDSDDPELKRQAIVLSGSYQVKETVPHLIEFLKKKDMFGKMSALKVTVVRALGQIGDERAIEPLIKLYHSRALFPRRTLRELRLEIFRNLGGYTQNALKPLISLGLKSRVQEIRDLCENRQVEVQTAEGDEDV